MSVHIEVILDKNNKNQPTKKQQHNKTKQTLKNKNK